MFMRSLKQALPAAIAVLIAALSLAGQNKTLPGGGKAPQPAARQEAKSTGKTAATSRQPQPQYCEVALVDKGHVLDPIQFAVSLTSDRTAAAGGSAAKPAEIDWDFGDGTSHSSERNPSHAYDHLGFFVWRVRVTEGARRCQALWVAAISGRPADAVVQSAATVFVGDALVEMYKELSRIVGQFPVSFPADDFERRATPKGTPAHPLRLRLGEKSPGTSTYDCDISRSDVGIVDDSGANPPAGRANESYEISPGMRLKNGEIPCGGRVSVTQHSVSFRDARVEAIANGMGDKNPRLKFTPGSIALLDGKTYAYDGTSWEEAVEAAGGNESASSALKSVESQASVAALAQYHSDARVRMAAAEYASAQERARRQVPGGSGTRVTLNTPAVAPAPTTIVGIADKLLDKATGREVWVLIADGEPHCLQFSEAQQATPQLFSVGQMYTVGYRPAGTRTVNGTALKVIAVETRN